MVKYCLLFIITLYSACICAYSKIGFTGGVSINGVTGDVIAQNYFNVNGDSYHLQFTDILGGFDLGVRLDAGTKNIILSAECSYRFSGSFYSVIDSIYSLNSLKDAVLGLTYLYTPVMIRLRSSTGSFIEAGGYFSTLINYDSYELANDGNYYLTEDYAVHSDLFNTVDYGWVTGLGIDKGIFSLGVRFSYSLNDFFTETYQEQTDFTTLYNIGLLATLKF